MRIFSAASGVFSLVSIDNDAGSEARECGRGVDLGARDRSRGAGSTPLEDAAPSAPEFPDDPRGLLDAGVEADLDASPRHTGK